jgi:Spy/CpxP family protein refolding chaperone
MSPTQPSLRIAITLLVLIAAATAAVAQTAPRAARAPQPARPVAPASDRHWSDADDDDDDHANPGLLGGMGMGPGMRGGALRMRAGMARMRVRRAELERELRLTDPQRNRIEEIRSRQMHYGIEQRAKIAEARLGLMELMRDDHADRAKLERQADEIVRLRSQLDRARIQMLLDMRSVLTPDQRKQLRDELQGSSR